MIMKSQKKSREYEQQMNEKNRRMAEENRVRDEWYRQNELNQAQYRRNLATQMSSSQQHTYAPTDSLGRLAQALINTPVYNPNNRYK
jgi:hypothetical protein